MKTTEIRVGNLLNFTFMNLTEQYSVFEIREDSILITSDISYQLSMASGIPLTEDWLIKLGFELNPRPGQVGFQMYRHTKYNDFQIEQFNNKQYIVDGIDQWLTNSSEIWNVHQLQNLFYSLTGTELL